MIRRLRVIGPDKARKELRNHKRLWRPRETEIQSLIRDFLNKHAYSQRRGDAEAWATLRICYP